MGDIFIADFGDHALVSADFCRDAVDVSGGVERGAGAFVHAATVPDVAAFAFLLVAF